MQPFLSPENKSSIWRQLIENPRGRGDLKQPAGFMSLLTLLYCAALAIPVSPYIALGLVAIVIVWFVGDVREAEVLLKAIYGGFKAPEVVNNNNKMTGDNSVINQPGGEFDAALTPDKQEA